MLPFICMRSQAKNLADDCIKPALNNNNDNNDNIAINNNNNNNNER